MTTPTTIRAIPGRKPRRKTTPPIAMLPVICWPQRSRKSEAERLRVSNGPVPSIAITGTERKVTSDQAAPTSRPAMSPSAPPWFSSAPMTTAIAVESAAQPQIAPRRELATAMPSPIVALSPRKMRSAQAARPTLK